MIFCEIFRLDYVLVQWYDITITKQKTNHKGENTMNKNLVNELVKELYNREITSCLDEEYTIKGACKALGIKPNKNIELIKEAYKKCVGENLGLNCITLLLA